PKRNAASNVFLSGVDVGYRPPSPGSRATLNCVVPPVGKCATPPWARNCSPSSGKRVVQQNRPEAVTREKRPGLAGPHRKLVHWGCALSCPELSQWIFNVT